LRRSSIHYEIIGGGANVQGGGGKAKEWMRSEDWLSRPRKFAEYYVKLAVQRESCKETRGQLLVQVFLEKMVWAPSTSWQAFSPTSDVAWPVMRRNYDQGHSRRPRDLGEIQSAGREPDLHSCRYFPAPVADEVDLWSG